MTYQAVFIENIGSNVTTQRQNENTLQRAMYWCCTKLKDFNANMINGRIVNIQSDFDFKEDVFDDSKPYEETNFRFEELPLDFDEQDLYNPETYDDLPDFCVSSRHINTIRDKVFSKADKIVVWAYNANDGCWPSCCFIKILNKHGGEVTKPV